MSNTEQPKTIQSISEILKHCSDGKMPVVESMVPIKHATSLRGTIATIKSDMIGVKFPGLKWETWFRESYNDDERSKYLRQLVLVNSSPVQGVEEAAVKSAEEILAKHLGWGKYEDGPLMANGDDIINAMKEYASQFQASRSKGVGMDYELLTGFIEWIHSDDDLMYKQGSFWVLDDNTDRDVPISTKQHFEDYLLNIGLINKGEKFESAPLSDNSPAEGESALEKTRDVLSGLIRTLSRISNNTPGALSITDKKRLTDAKFILSKYYDGNQPKIVQSAPLSDNSPEVGRETEVLCCRCNKRIDETGTSLEGKPCHIACFHRAKFYESYPGESDNDTKDLIIHGITEGAEQWKQEATEWKRKYEELKALSASPGSEEHRCPYCNSMNVKSSFVSGNHRGNDVDIEIYGCTDCKKEFTDLDLNNTPGSEGKEEKTGCAIGHHDIVPVLGYENMHVGEECRVCGRRWDNAGKEN